MNLEVLKNKERIERCMVVEGDNVEIRDRSGKKEIKIDCKIGEIECVKELMENIKVEEKNNENIRYHQLMKKIKKKIEERKYDGKMCVNLEEIGGNVDVIRNMIWLGEKINDRDGKSGRNVMKYEVEYGIKRVIRFIIEE
jgi:hypothetical protein